MLATPGPLNRSNFCVQHLSVIAYHYLCGWERVHCSNILLQDGDEEGQFLQCKMEQLLLTISIIRHL